MNDLPDPRLRTRFTVSADGCWEWSGARTGYGYGRISWKGRVERVHRVAAHLALGLDLADGRVVCHHCDNPPCYRPDHLFIGTLSDNTQDMLAKGRDWGGPKPRELCRKGIHPLAGDNLVLKGGGRRCRTCWNEYQRTRYHQADPNARYKTEPEHGAIAMYRRGCRCELCRGANAEAARSGRAYRRQITDLAAAYGVDADGG